jgi:hypothetical protein
MKVRAKNDGDTAPARATRSNVARVYVDTNIFMDFYQSAHDRIGVFTELLDRAGSLITTEQTLAEFERNRAQGLSALIDAFSKSTDVEPYTTAIITSLEEWEPLIQKRDEYKKQAKEVLSRLKSFRADPSTDPVFKKFREVMGAKGVKVIQTTDELITRAHQRKLLGNPPSSPGKHTIGDELIWESLLAGCGDDLVIVSRDRTFTAHEAFLRDEYAKRTGKKLLEVSNVLTKALKLVGVGSELVEKEEHDLPGVDDDAFGSPWDEDSIAALASGQVSAKFDFEKGEMYVPDDTDHGEGMRTISSLEEFDEWASETAFSGYNNSAPRDSGEWVFPFDESHWIDVARDMFEEELEKLGWS